MAKITEYFLSDRQMKILRHLFLFSASTIEQIKRDVFDKCSIKIPYREMKRLENYGLVEKRPFVKKGRYKGAYILTAEGFGYFADREEIRGKKYAPSSLLHDLELVDIAFRCKKINCLANYYTENQLLNEGEGIEEEAREAISGFRPDALMKLEDDGKTFIFAIEYEASRKYAVELRDKVNRYYDNPELYGVLYICRERETMNRAKAVDKKENGKETPKVFYILLKDFQKSKKNLEVFNRNGKKLTIS